MVIRRFTDEEIQTVNQISVLGYARIRGYPVVEYARGYYKIHGYGGLLINPVKNCWSWESMSTVEKKIGGGPVQFVMQFEKATWVQAVKILLAFKEDYPDNTMETIADSNTGLPKAKNKTVNKSDFKLPPKNTTYEHIFAYLIKVRRLDQGLVQRMVKENKLYEDIHRNCVFVGYDQQGVARFAALRGTNTHIPFRGNPEGADKQYPFCIAAAGDGKRLYVFEAAIDLLSYMTLQIEQEVDVRKNHYVSLAGYSMIGLQAYLQLHPDITEIYVGTDNDEKGISAYENVLQIYKGKYCIERVSPEPQKDWNGYLCMKRFREELQLMGRGDDI